MSVSKFISVANIEKKRQMQPLSHAILRVEPLVCGQRIVNHRVDCGCGLRSIDVEADFPAYISIRSASAALCASGNPEYFARMKALGEGAT